MRNPPLVKFPLLDIPSNITFPTVLRQAIPDNVDGRMLNLQSMDAEPANTMMCGPRVRIRFTVGESGALHGQWPVLVDLESKVARALAQSILEMADRAENLVPGPGW